jgi:hypothetical protein
VSLVLKSIRVVRDPCPSPTELWQIVLTHELPLRSRVQSAAAQKPRIRGSASEL